jgi:amino acid transporter
LSLTHAVLYGVGVTVGAGIYVLVGVAAGQSGLHAPIAFLAAAIAMGFTAAAFAELGTRMPISASEAAYVEAAFHRRRLSLAMGLLVVATASISAATISSGSAGYIGVFVDVPPVATITGVVLLMGVVASLATAQSIAVAGVMTLVEVGGLLVIVIAGVADDRALLTALPTMFSGLANFSVWVGIGSTTLLAVFAFIGFEHIVNVAEELKRPGRDLPRALFLTLAVTTVLYVLVVWIAVTSVAPAQLARSPAPLAEVFRTLTRMSPRYMSVIAVIATLNGVVVHMIMIARVLYGLAGQGNLPAPLATISPLTRTPLRATGVGVLVILVLSLAVPLAGLAAWAARGTLLIFAGVNVALIRIKAQGIPAPDGVFNCPVWVAYAGVFFTLLLLAADLLA